jgi:hypothetical protein
VIVFIGLNRNLMPENGQKSGVQKGTCVEVSTFCRRFNKKSSKNLDLGYLIGGS